MTSSLALPWPWLPGLPGGGLGEQPEALDHIQENMDALVLAVGSIGASQSFVTPTFTNSWVDAGAPNAACGYYKDRQSRVHLQGAVKNGSAGVAAVFTLPAGYRPSGRLQFAVAANSGPLIGQVTSAGVINFPSGGDLTGTWLDGISFRAA